MQVGDGGPLTLQLSLMMQVALRACTILFVRKRNKIEHDNTLLQPILASPLANIVTLIAVSPAAAHEVQAQDASAVSAAMIMSWSVIRTVTATMSAKPIAVVHMIACALAPPIRRQARLLLLVSKYLLKNVSYLRLTQQGLPHHVLLQL